MFLNPKTVSIGPWSWARVPAGASWPGFCGGFPRLPKATLPRAASSASCREHGAVHWRRGSQHKIDLTMPTRRVGVTMRLYSGGRIHDSQSDADSCAHVFRCYVAQRAKQTFHEVGRTHCV